MSHSSNDYNDDDDDDDQLISGRNTLNSKKKVTHNIEDDYDDDDDDDLDGDVDGNDDGDDDIVVCTPGNELTGRWTRKEHEIFLDALKKYGREWKKVLLFIIFHYNIILN